MQDSKADACSNDKHLLPACLLLPTSIQLPLHALPPLPQQMLSTRMYDPTSYGVQVQWHNACARMGQTTATTQGERHSNHGP